MSTESTPGRAYLLSETKQIDTDEELKFESTEDADRLDTVMNSSKTKSAAKRPIMKLDEDNA